MSPDVSGPSAEGHNGNGSLMRVLPLVLWHRGDDQALVQLAGRQSLPTHGHPRSQIACAVYCLWARAVLEKNADPWESAVARFHAKGCAELFPADEVRLVLDSGNATAARGTGYVVDTLWSAKAAVESTTSFEACVHHAVRLGHDTDTTAAVAGGIAGILYGHDAIPSRWRNALRASDLYEPLLTRLLEPYE